MITVTLILVFIVGIIFGSFLNVLLFRTGRFGGRSHCFSCGEIIKWYDLVPVLSFLILKGRCRFCGSRISIQYPIIEFVSGLLFVLAFLQNESILAFVIFAFIFLDLLFIFIYDLKHKIVGDWPVIVLLILSIFYYFVINNFNFSDWFLEDLSFAIFSALPILVLWAISRGKWIGFGDVKLIFPLGFIVGTNWFSGFLLSFWIGAIVSLFLILVTKLNKFFPVKFNLGLKSEVPFAPFLIIGFFLTYLFNIDLISLLDRLI